MSAREMLKKVRYLEIRTKGLVNNLFSGEYHSAFKGRGMAFSEVRPYQYGDDIRQIDWNVTARSQQPFIKLFEEEREQTVMIAVDVSGSGQFGSFDQRKQDLNAELAAVFAFSAIKNNDKVGLILFTDEVEQVIPPRKGRKHVLRLIREIFSVKPARKGTSVREALGYVNRMLKRRSIVVCISDMQDANYEKTCKMTARKHDLIMLCVDDVLEYELPNLGLVPLKDPETGQILMVDTSDASVREEFASERKKNQMQLADFLLKNKIDHVFLKTNASYVQPLSSMLRSRVQHV
ncbi:MAG: DUF58 domain-containing protein [Balneolales bacterium]|nr:DUF58 domain-containing protein [Balneolales bacterium]